MNYFKKKKKNQEEKDAKIQELINSLFKDEKKK